MRARRATIERGDADGGRDPRVGGDGDDGGRASRGAEGCTGRLAALERPSAAARELERVKAMLMDIVATQSNVLAALASHRSIDREEAVRGEAVERRRGDARKASPRERSERRDDARFGRDDDSAAIAIATDEDEGEMSESQLQRSFCGGCSCINAA